MYLHKKISTYFVHIVLQNTSAAIEVDTGRLGTGLVVWVSLRVG